jgi:flagellar motor switch protein FliN/FliY
VSLAEDLKTTSDFALAFTAAVDSALGADSQLTIGDLGPSITSVIGSETARVVAAPFTLQDGQAGTIVLAALAEFATLLERTAPDELIATTVTPGFEGAIQSIATTQGTDSEIETARETDLATLVEAGNSAAAVYPVVSGDDTVGCIAIYLTADQESADGDLDAPGDARSALAPQAGGNAFVLADVEMGVTAELGRCRMSMRELLSITPGAVIDLDRAASAPVDVLVNGTLIARGEVVVIEEEFGIRISEILPEGAHTT